MKIPAGLVGRELGEAVIDVVLTYPEQHDQDHVVLDKACGTTACIAGWAVALHYGLSPLSLATDKYFELAGNDYMASVSAPRLLGVDSDKFRKAVYAVGDRDTAISNFKHLLDETYSEQTS